MSIASLFANGNLPNLVFIITDQERNLQHYPADFLSNLPAMTQLMNTGLTFQEAHTAACMCSPSRATFLTSNYPQVTQVTTTGSPEPPNPLPLPATYPNLATVLLRAGYKQENIAWRGKWHLGNAPDNTPNQYGFSGWALPDAGNYLTSVPEAPTSPAMESLGGGTADNDGKLFLPEALTFLSNAASANEPFCLVLSLVNPHDVFVGRFDLDGSGYDASAFTDVPVKIPTNANEDLVTNNKPRAQESQSWIPVAATQQNYVNFYAYLQTLVDGQIQQVLDQLSTSNLTDSTLIIRFADHGEMGLSHSLVEKFYNAYEETTNIPLIFSNPKVWPAAQTTSALASSLDLVPTIASLLGVAGDFTGFKGYDLTAVLEDPAATGQTELHFTYDDVPTSLGPSVVRNIRTAGYSYSVYFEDVTSSGGSDGDWELYDLGIDPDEMDNVAGKIDYGLVQKHLDQELQKLMHRNGTMPAFEWPPQQTADSVGGPPAIAEVAIAAALSKEIATLLAAGNASVGRLAEILYAAGTPLHLVVRAARALAQLDTRQSYAALQRALYGSPSWPRSVTAQVHGALALRKKRAG